MNPIKVWATVRHLRPAQIAHRLWRLGVRRGTATNLAGTWRLRPRVPSPPACRSDAGFDGGSFTFLNVRLPFDGPDRWSPRNADRLWTYNLHYFRYLPGLPARIGLQLVEDWLEANRSLEGPGWEPYPIALRVREWIEWLLGLDGLEAQKRADLVASVATQVEALAAQLEYHLDGNHLLEDAISLCWAGLSIDGPQSDAWLRSGRQLLADCLAEQLLPDGGHDERSPMYQALLAEALLRLAEVASGMPGDESAAVRRLSLEAGGALTGALGSMTHPDGGIALLNDAALCIGPTLSELVRRFPSLQEESPGKAFDLPQTGYAGYRGDRGDYLVFDRGPLGPDHQPGHGHADTLAFELSAFGARVVTDSGVYSYNPGPVRAADRSTAAHSTVAVDGRDQAELWSAFRCGERPKVTEARGRVLPNGVILEGSYDGPFGSLGSVRHARTLRYESGVSLQGVDEVSCDGSHVAAVRFHLAPGLAAHRVHETIEVRDGVSKVLEIKGPEMDWVVERTPYHPEFGKEIERDCVVGRARFRDRACLSWHLQFRREQA